MPLFFRVAALPIFFFSVKSKAFCVLYQLFRMELYFMTNFTIWYDLSNDDEWRIFLFRPHNKLMMIEEKKNVDEKK